MHLAPVYHLFVGVDIAATTFTAVWGMSRQPLAPPQTFPQDAAGFAAFQQQLAATAVAPEATLIVLEATGSYWVALAVALHAAGYHISVINPAQLHNYAKSLPRRSKTDALDAQVVWQFAHERHPVRWTPPPAIYHDLRQRLVARDALIEMRQQARNQRHALQQWPVVVAAVLAQFDTLVADLDRRIAALDTDIATVLRDGAWAESAALLQSIPGIGPTTAAWLLVATLNFELCATPQAAVAYAGLNPLTCVSGTSVRGRPQLGRGGHRRLRTALYLASVSAVRYNPPLKAFYERLRARGKPMKVARCAAARKLLHLAWAVVTKRQSFTPDARPAAPAPRQA
jgi:transposase